MSTCKVAGEMDVFVCMLCAKERMEELQKYVAGEMDVFVGMLCAKERTEELQKYVEILKAEKQQLELMGRASRDSFSSLFSSPSGNIRRVCYHTIALQIMMVACLLQSAPCGPGYPPILSLFYFSNFYSVF